jgi:[ribosomal protein S18]-alanine N-acetyltransferase
MWTIRRLAEPEVDTVGLVLGLARLGQGDGFYLVAWDGEQPLGHAYLALTDPPELQDVEVRLEHRRRGVASALTTSAEAAALERGFGHLRLQVSANNGPAQALYQGLGFRDVGIPPRRVQGTVQIRTGPIEVDDTLLTWEKAIGDPVTTAP